MGTGRNLPHFSALLVDATDIPSLRVLLSLADATLGKSKVSPHFTVNKIKQNSMIIKNVLNKHENTYIKGIYYNNVKNSNYSG